MSSSTSSQTIPATVLPRLVATTLVVLHDQVHAPRPTAAQMATLVDTTLRRAHQLADVTPPPPLATVLVRALAETINARLAAVIPPPSGPLPPGMISEEVARWDDPGHPGYWLEVDPEQIPDWLPPAYLAPG